MKEKTGKTRKKEKQDKIYKNIKNRILSKRVFKGWGSEKTCKGGGGGGEAIGGQLKPYVHEEYVHV